MNRKQRVFVEEYLTCWNASEAARRAGYTGKPNVIGPRLLAKDSIQAYIIQRMQDKTMKADEVLYRLHEMATGAHAQYMTKERGFDLQKMIEEGKAYLIKGMKINSQGYPEYEFYDAQAALVHLGKHYKLFTDKLETENNLTIRVEGLTELLDKVYGSGS